MNKNILRLALAAMAVIPAASSCSLDDDDNSYYDIYPNAVLTVKTAPDNTLYYQLDDSTTLVPKNITKNPYKGECRALANLKVLDEKPLGDYDKVVYVNWIDSILTKPTVPATEDDDKAYGSDCIDILGDWVNVVEDGYLTLHIVGSWGEDHIVHTINLVRNVDSKDPYVVELRHDANGDEGGRMAGSYVAFRLGDLPDTQGKTVDLTLKWKSPTGEKSQVFKYRTRKD